MKRYTPLFEKIYGFTGFAYHRTRVENIGNLMTQKYKPGSGDMYGKGFYSTYELSSQLRPNMVNVYGDFIVKTKIDLTKVLILDYNEAKKLYKGRKEYQNDFTLVKQLLNFGIYKSLKNVPENIKEISKQLTKEKITSDYALKILHYNEIKNNINGIIFTGSRDGQVLVLYNIDQMYPTAFMHSPEGKETDWVQIKSNKNVIEYINNKFFSKGNILIEYPDWVEQADKRDFKIEMDGNNLIWKKGTWYGGTWYDGTWKEGIWNDGTWYDGTWENGTWNDGTWERGSWENGIWENGTWYIGTWEKGIWNDGEWYDGTWYNGTWKDGEWYNGTWEKGIWGNGTWEKGTWERGSWNNGTWKGGTWKGGIWKNGTWNWGTWENGDWKDGTWKEGIWKDGDWEKGTWERGSWENGTWVEGWIYDPQKKGDFDIDNEWKGDYVHTKLNPKEYFA